MGDETMNYLYTAMKVDEIRGGPWLVKRFSNAGDQDWEEALISGEFADAGAAIQAAVERGSWA